MNWKEVKKMLVNKNFIGKKDDAFPYLIILGAYQEGVEREKVREWLGNAILGRVKEFNRMWQIAIDNEIFIDGCISVEDPDEGLTNIELGLYGGVLLGYLTRSVTKT